MKQKIAQHSIALAAVLYACGAVAANVEIHVPDGITSWTELKLYQTRTLRNVNMSCLARYEKVFKPGSAENQFLLTTGGAWSRVIVQKCPKKDNNASADSEEDPSTKCTYMSLQDYKKAGNTGNDGSSYTIPQTKIEGWPNSWRGYLADDKEENQFPNFGKDNAGGDGGGDGDDGGGKFNVDGIKKMFGQDSSSGSSATGLDKAQLGDIMLMPKGASGKNSKPGLPKVAMISELHLGKDCKTQAGGCYVQVLEVDNGKWPDVCGTTDTNGDLKTRYYYKTGELPPGPTADYKRIKSQTKSCEDTKLGHCEFELWNDVKLYRIRKDFRKGCDKEQAKECGEDSGGDGE